MDKRQYWKNKWEQRLKSMGKTMQSNNNPITQIGVISHESLNYLNEINVLNEEGDIVHPKTWSMFCHVYYYLKEVTTAHEPLTPDDIVRLMQDGELDKPYTQQGQEYVDKLKNSLVGDFHDQYVELRRQAEQRAVDQGKIKFKDTKYLSKGSNVSQTDF